MAEKKQIQMAAQGLYRDRQNRLIYYHKRQHCGYLIPEKAQSRFGIFANRYLVVAAVAVFLNFLLRLELWLTALLVFLLAVFMEWYWRFKLFSSYGKLENFQPEKYIDRPQQAPGVSQARLRFLAAFYGFVSLFILIFLLFYHQNLAATLLVAAFAVSGLVLAYRLYRNSR